MNRWSSAARQVVFNDLDWVPANHWQAEDRAYRIGQTASVNVHYLVAAATRDVLSELKANDVTCTCPGFEYRGTCSHSRTLKEALVTHAPLPAGYQEVPCP